MASLMAATSDRESGTPTSSRPTATPVNVALAAALLVTLPPLVYYLWICLEYEGGRLVLPCTELQKYVPLPTATSIVIVGVWLAFQAGLQVAAPGPWVEGPPLHVGPRLKYKLNGWFGWWFTWACLGSAVALDLFPPTLLADQFGPLLTTLSILVYGFSGYLYWHGKRRGRPHERTTGTLIYDFWLGSELNPRVGNFDFKLFCKARLGLIGWVAINLSLAAKQWELYGRLTPAMILTCCFHFLYVTDYYYHEEAALTTWDIKHENFGFMLCFRDLVWVPFTYTLLAYYLVTHTDPLPDWALLSSVLLALVGYTILRGANLQKHRFRKYPERPIWGSPPQYIATARGALLLTSGYWGLARHMNYFGDLLLALAWCLLAGFGHPLPYFYLAYITVLLVHRERRDHDMCAVRYGRDWKTYCQQVRWRILKGVY